MGLLCSLLAAVATLQLSHASPTPAVQQATSTLPAVAMTSPSPALTSSGPCATMLAEYSSQYRTSEAYPTVAAQLGYDCLRQLPFNQSSAALLMDGIEPYLEFETTFSWVKQPPPDYTANVQGPYDFWAAWNDTRRKVTEKAFSQHFDFENELSTIARALKQSHFYIDLPSKEILSFSRSIALVATSLNGSSPEIFARDDIIDLAAGRAKYVPSAVVQIDGEDALSTIMQWGQLVTPAQDPDAIFNTLMYSLAHSTNLTRLDGADDWASGYIDNVYPGPSTTLQFRNGTNSTTENFATIYRDIGIGTKLDGYYSYPYWVTHSIILDAISNPNRPYYPPTSATSYATSLPATQMTAHSTPTPSPASNVLERRGQSASPVSYWHGYPSAIVSRPGHNVNKGFFLDQDGYDDVAVLAIPTFGSPNNTFEITREITKRTIAMAKAQGKKHFIVDVSGNGGGLINEGVDVFKQLFPNQTPWAGGQLHATTEANALGTEMQRVIRAYSSNARPDLATQYSDLYTSYWSYRDGVTSGGAKFTSWAQRFGPHHYGPAGDAFTPEIQFDLRDCELFASGYCNDTDIPPTPAFAPADVVIITDGYCGSTCSTFAYNMMHLAGVRAVAMGGRPGAQKMQAVGATRGGGITYAREVMTLINETTNVGGAPSVERWTDSPMQRFSLVPAIGGLDVAVNLKNEVARKDVNTSNPTPLQFIYEPADCRIWYTPEMIVDQSAVWRAVADAAWGGKSAARCVGGPMGDTGLYLESAPSTGNSDAGGGGSSGGAMLGAPATWAVVVWLALTMARML